MVPPDSMRHHPILPQAWVEARHPPVQSGVMALTVQPDPKGSQLRPSRERPWGPQTVGKGGIGRSAAWGLGGWKACKPGRSRGIGGTPGGGEAGGLIGPPLPSPAEPQLPQQQDLTWTCPGRQGVGLGKPPAASDPGVSMAVMPPAGYPSLLAWPPSFDSLNLL